MIMIDFQTFCLELGYFFISPAKEFQGSVDSYPLEVAVGINIIFSSVVFPFQ